MYGVNLKCDEDRLLTDEEIVAVEERVRDTMDEDKKWGMSHTAKDQIAASIRGISEAQLAKDMKWEDRTASIKDAECQERIKRIYEEIEKHRREGGIELHFAWHGVIMEDSEWQALKNKHLTNLPNKYTMIGMKIKIFRCLRCSHEWPSKQEHPTICPKCKTPYWDKERR